MPAEIDQNPKQNQVALWRVLSYLEFVAIACLGGDILWKGVLLGWRNLGSDFPQYYLGAKLIAEHYRLDRFYEWAWLQRQAVHFGIHHELVGFSGLTPFSTFLLLPFEWLNPLQAKQVWILLNIAVLIATVQLLAKTCGFSISKAWFIALLAALPLRNDLALGQMHLIVFALLVLAWRFHINGKQIASGFCIALAGALKIYPLFYCLYFVVKKRRRALGSAVAATVACGGACVALFGATATGVFIGRQLRRLLNGEALDPFLVSSTSATTMFHRLFLFEPEWNPHPLVYSPLLFALCYALWQALPTAIVLSQLRPAFKHDRRETLEWCAFLTLLMFLSSQPETYHFVALIGVAIPTYAILSASRPRLGWLFLVIYIIACNARNILPGNRVPPVYASLLVPKLWAGAGLIVLYLAVLSSESRDLAQTSKVGGLLPPGSERRHDRRLRVSVFGMFLPVLWLLGFTSSFRHWKSMGIVHPREIVEPDGAWMRAEPRDTANGMYYVAMLRSGYKVMRDGLPAYDLPGDDQLSYAADHEGKTLWVESVASTEPVISEVRGGETLCEIHNAESPALSREEESLAFIREERGRGSLWIADSRTCGVREQPLRVTPRNVDVRAVDGAPDGHFIVSAMTINGPMIFLVSRKVPPEALVRPGGDVESMAISGDTDTILLSERVGEHWQIVSESLLNHQVRQLTYGACNATDPSFGERNRVLYATDCRRGMGLTALAEMSPHN